ncbi:hypothetical protein GWP57_04265 [Gammaproteobacteria bacterium]|jgi:hypothetical protein|nr:hypothetical protein [Gammaproteobacteria bacterium]
MNSKLRLTATLALGFTLITGCASQTGTERDFGNSVRAVTASQIYDSGAALYPEKEAVTGGNGNRLENVVEAHTGDVANSQQVQKPIDFGIAGN